MLIAARNAFPVEIVKQGNPAILNDFAEPKIEGIAHLSGVIYPYRRQTQRSGSGGVWFLFQGLIFAKYRVKIADNK